MTLEQLGAAIERMERKLDALARPAAVETLTTDQAAEVAGVHPATLRRWIKDGRLRARHRGRSLRIERADLERAVAGESALADEILGVGR